MDEITKAGIERWGVVQGDRVRMHAVNFGSMSTPEQDGTVVGFQEIGGAFGLCVLIQEDGGPVRVHAFRDFRKIEKVVADA